MEEVTSYLQSHFRKKQLVSDYSYSENVTTGKHF